MEGEGVRAKGSIFASVSNQKAKMSSLFEYCAGSITGTLWGLKSFVTSRGGRPGEVQSGVNTPIVVQMAPEEGEKVMGPVAHEDGEKVVGQVASKEVQAPPDEGEKVVVQAAPEKGEKVVVGVAPEEGEKVMDLVASKEGEKVVVPVAPEKGKKVVVPVASEEGDEVVVQVAPEEGEKVMGQIAPKEVQVPPGEGDKVVVLVAPGEGKKVVGQVASKEVQVRPDEGEKVVVQAAPNEGEKVVVPVAPEKGEKVVVPVAPEEGDKVVVQVVPKEGEQVMGQVAPKDVQVPPGEGDKVVVLVAPEEGKKVVGQVASKEVQAPPDEGEKVVVQAAPEEEEKVVVPLAPVAAKKSILVRVWNKIDEAWTWVKAKMKSALKLFSESMNDTLLGVRSFVTSSAEKLREVLPRINTQIDKYLSEKKLEKAQEVPEEGSLLHQMKMLVQKARKLVDDEWLGADSSPEKKIVGLKLKRALDVVDRLIELLEYHKQPARLLMVLLSVVYFIYSKSNKAGGAVLFSEHEAKVSMDLGNLATLILYSSSLWSG